jgi:phosphoglycerate dehydrogenase-like enzyme
MTTSIAVWLIWPLKPVISCWTINERQVDKLKQLLPGTRIIHCKSEEEFVSALKTAEISITWIFKLEYFKAAPQLKKVVTPAAGIDFFPIEIPSHIKLVNSGFHGEIMGETVAAMILSHARGIMKSYSFQGKLPWPRNELEPYMKNVRGSCITILGFGHIGQWVGRLMKPFGVRLIGVKRKPEPGPDYFDSKDKIVIVKDLNNVLPETDHLVMALPRTEETTHIIKKEQLELLPSHAAVYNVGRGNAIDEEALVEALETKVIGAAYLDVFQQEPLPADSPLHICPNCYLMPHASAIASNYLDLFIREFVLKYLNWQKQGL